MSSALNTHQADPECPSPRSSEASDACKELELDVIEWHQKYQSCQRYFIDHAQHSAPVQALCAFLNIQLPFQKSPYPVSSSTAHARRFSPRTSAANVAPPPRLVSVPSSISLIPFLRRLVAAGMDSPGVLHAFFGNDWLSGVGKLHEQERQNYLFAAKNDDGWTAVKEDYDGRPSEPTHALRQLQNPLDFELEAADLGWIEWFAMEDWAIGM